MPKIKQRKTGFLEKDYQTIHSNKLVQCSKLGEKADHHNIFIALQAQ